LRRTKGAKNIPKKVLKTRLKIKENTYTLVFVKYLVGFSEATFGTLSVFLEDSLKIISGT
jgi:hypothetical protein